LKLAAVQCEHLSGIGPSEAERDFVQRLLHRLDRVHDVETARLLVELQVGHECGAQCFRADGRDGEFRGKSAPGDGFPVERLGIQACLRGRYVTRKTHLQRLTVPSICAFCTQTLREIGIQPVQGDIGARGIAAGEGRHAKRLCRGAFRHGFGEHLLA
jgi:hypothetical protein